MADTRHPRGLHARAAGRTIRRNPRLAMKIAAPLALLATVAPVSIGVFTGEVAPSMNLAGIAVAEGGGERLPEVSRSAPRLVPTAAELARIERDNATAAAVARALKNQNTMWTTEETKLWSGPGKAATLTAELKAGREFLVTGRADKGRAEIVFKGQAGWLDEDVLSSTKPIIAASGLSMAPCPRTNGDEGLTPKAAYVLRSVCAAFPQISTYGGRDPHGEHVNGEAIDIMTSDYALGTAIAEFLIKNASEFGIEDVIWRQRIWMPSFGWKGMSNRGSATANHFDHVHVKVY